MRLIILGAPGAGKGTQAVRIAAKFSIPHISTGDIFRYNIKNNTELGVKAKGYIDNGQLVPDEVTVKIVEDRLKDDDCKKGFILDGFPRTINQAEALDTVLNELKMNLTMVLNISIDDEVVVKRLAGRRLCSNCNEGYHLIYNPPKNENICDICKNSLVQRDDDKEETILNRLKTYHNQSEPLKVYYGKKDLLKNAQSQESIDDTSKEVYKLMGVNNDIKV